MPIRSPDHGCHGYSSSRNSVLWAFPSLVVQHDQAPRLNRIQATSTRGVRARIRRVAGCAPPTGSAGHASATAHLKLTFHLDHSVGANQTLVRRPLKDTAKLPYTFRVPETLIMHSPRGTNSMTSPSQYRHIPLRRLLRDSLKRLYFAFYKFGVRLGVHILPAHYYATVPNIIELERTVDLWAKPSAMSGVDIDLDEQIDNLRRVCTPFQHEFRSNPYYKHAVNQPFRSGRSRFFGYIEAQVLHAVVRYYKPAQLIEIGGGVPSYCTSQAISFPAGMRQTSGPSVGQPQGRGLGEGS